MQKKKTNTIKLGVFVFIGLLLFTIAIYYIGKKQQMFTNNFRISGIFKNINGLQVGNNVRFSGINVGVVEGIEMIADTAIKVDMLIGSSARKFITKGAKATIGSDGLMGSKLLIIMPGDSGQKRIQNNDIIATTVPVSLDDILGKLKIASTNAADITDDLSVVMNNLRTGKGTIGKLFMDPAFAQNIDQSIVNIKQGTSGFKNNMDAVGNSFLLRKFIKKKKKKQEKPK